MNEENQVETMEESSALSDELLNAINEDWDTDVLPGYNPADEEEQEKTADSGENADQQEAKEPQDKAAETEIEPEKAKAETDQFELKHLDETRTVSREEVITLAQKGMDYDRIRTKYDELKAGEAQRSAHEAFLKELADSAGQSVEDVIDTARARMLANKAAAEGKTLSEEDALEQIKQEKAKQAPAEKPESTEEKSTEKDRDAERQQSFLRFSREFPEVKAEEIPAEVWKDFAEGKGDLADLFARQENKRLKAELAAMKQNEENRKKSTGSRATAGSAKKSAFDEAWYDGT